VCSSSFGCDQYPSHHHKAVNQMNQEECDIKIVVVVAFAVAAAAGQIVVQVAVAVVVAAVPRPPQRWSCVC